MTLRRSVLGSGPQRLLLDAADASAVDGSDSDVTLLTPGLAPRVPDDVVVLTVLGAIADGGDGVVEVGAASGGVEDAGLVKLEGELVGLDGDGDGLLGDGGLELGDGVGGDVRVVVNEVLLEGGIGLAGAGDAGAGSVRVVGLELVGGGLEVLEGGVLPATVATEGGVVARDDLLLGHGDELAGLDEVSTLEGCDGGEGPAGTAASLVLDVVDGTLGPPVDVSVVGLGKSGVLDVLAGVNLGAEDGLVLGVGPGGELVVANSVGAVLGVVLHDEGVLLGEEGNAHVVLLGGGVGKAELVHVSGEAGLQEVLGEHNLGADGGLKAEAGNGVAEEVHYF